MQRASSSRSLQLVHVMTVFVFISPVCSLLISADLKDLLQLLFFLHLLCCTLATIFKKNDLHAYQISTYAICFYRMTVNIWQGRAQLGFNPEVRQLDEKNLRSWTLGGVINEVVNIGVSSMAALRRPLLQGRGRAEGYSVRSWQLSQNQSRILK